MTRWRDAQAVLDGGIAACAFSAVSAEIGRRDGPLWTYAAGHLGFDTRTPVSDATIFDLASLTKVLVTTMLALVARRRGELDLDACVHDIVREWAAADRSTVTIRDLLEHSAGLPAHREYFHELVGLDAYVSAIASEPLAYAPRTQAIYSDLGFILLGAALERVRNGALDAQFNAWKSEAGLAIPLTYRPPTEWHGRTAMTGHDPWRGRVLQGEVHDNNAVALGGVAAHAGLFGTASAVGACARWWLQQLATPDGVLFAQRSSVPGSSRAPGWDTMLPTSSCGTRMSPRAIGHTGFTGTSLWLDPARDLYFVLLTNRVLATNSNDAIQQVRRAFHDAANRALP